MPSYAGPVVPPVPPPSPPLALGMSRMSLHRIQSAKKEWEEHRRRQFRGRGGIEVHKVVLGGERGTATHTGGSTGEGERGGGGGATGGSLAGGETYQDHSISAPRRGPLDSVGAAQSVRKETAGGETRGPGPTDGGTSAATDSAFEGLGGPAGPLPAAGSITARLFHLFYRKATIYDDDCEASAAADLDESMDFENDERRVGVGVAAKNSNSEGDRGLASIAGRLFHHPPATRTDPEPEDTSGGGLDYRGATIYEEDCGTAAANEVNESLDFEEAERRVEHFLPSP